MNNDAPSPNIDAPSPNMDAPSPNIDAPSPNIDAPSSLSAHSSQTSTHSDRSSSLNATPISRRTPLQLLNGNSTPAKKIRKGFRQRISGFMLNPNLKSLITDAQAQLNVHQTRKISVMQFQIEKKSVSMKQVNLLKEKHEKEAISLQNLTVVVYEERIENTVRFTILDGRHRIEALKQWYLGKYGPDSCNHIDKHMISAIIITDPLTEAEQALVGWVAHSRSPVMERVRYDARKNVWDLYSMRNIFFPNMIDSATLSRSNSGKLRSRIKAELSLEIPEHHIYIAFCPASEKGIMLQLCDFLDRQSIESSSVRIDNDRTPFWREFVTLYDCTRIARHTVMQRPNNVIVYRHLEDLLESHTVTKSFTGSQFFQIRGARDDALPDDENEPP